jgi:hypothetical protein
MHVLNADTAGIMNLQKSVRHICVVAGVALSVPFGEAYATDAHEQEAHVYSEVLNRLVRNVPKHDRVSVVVSSDSMSMEQAYREISQFPPASLEEDMSWRLRRAKKETVKNFVKKSAAAHAVRISSADLSKNITASLASQASIDEIFRGDYAKSWERFAQHHSGARYLIYFSPIGFDTARREALVYIHRVCAGLCGSGELVLLRQAKGRWTVLEVHQFWIS